MKMFDASWMPTIGRGLDLLFWAAALGLRASTKPSRIPGKLCTKRGRRDTRSLLLEGRFEAHNSSEYTIAEVLKATAKHFCHQCRIGLGVDD